MQLTINHQLLAAELALINRVVPEKATLPILRNVFLRAENGQLQLYATDLRIGFSTSCRATVTVPGTATVPAKTFLDIVQYVSSDVQMTLNNSQVVIKSGSFTSKLQTLPASDFPGRVTPPTTGMKLSLMPFRAMIERTKYAISEKPGKYVMNGALLTVAGPLAAMVATDGKRLSVATMDRSVTTMDRSGNSDESLSAIIPKETLDAMLSLLDDDPTFSQVDNQMFFACGDRLLTSQKIDGEFPSYKRVIPIDSDKRAVIDRSLLAAALRRVGLVADKTQAAYFQFEPERLTITANSSEIGDAVEPIPVRYTGQPVKVCANWQFLLDFLNVAVEPTVTVELKTDADPWLLTDGTNFLNVVMGIRV